MYALLFSDTAIKKLNKLDRGVRERIFSALERIRIRPEHYVRRLANSTYYRLRVGDYRVMLDIQNDKLIILVITVGHRSRVYDRG